MQHKTAPGPSSKEFKRIKRSRIGFLFLLAGTGFLLFVWILWSNQRATDVLTQPTTITLSQRPLADASGAPLMQTGSSVPMQVLEHNLTNLQQQYKRWGFHFGPLVEHDGRTRARGTSAERWVEVEFVERDGKLVQAAAMLTPTNEVETQQRNVMYVTALPELLAPDWDEGTLWLETNLAQVVQQIQRGELADDRVFTDGDRSIRLHTHVMSEVLMVLVTVDVGRET